MRTLSKQFSATAKWLHWLAAFFLISLLATALQFPFQSIVEKQAKLPTHASIGVIVIMLTLLRLAWRRVSPPPDLPDGSPDWVGKSAKAGHRLLYALILYQGVLGLWLASLSAPDIRFFNGWNISALAPADPALVDALRPFHLAGAIAITALLFAHVLGALYHHFVLRDDVLIRMLPFGGLWQRLTTPARNALIRFPSLYIKNWPKRVRHEELG